MKPTVSVQVVDILVHVFPKYQATFSNPVLPSQMPTIRVGISNGCGRGGIWSQIICCANFRDPASFAFGIIPAFKSLTKAKQFAFSLLRTKYAPYGAILYSRKRRDLNPRRGVAPYTISSRAPSTTQPLFRSHFRATVEVEGSILLPLVGRPTPPAFVVHFATLPCRIN